MKALITISWLFLLSACANQENEKSPIDSSSIQKDSIVNTEPEIIDEGILVYKGDTFYSHEKALEFAKAQEVSKPVVDACDKYLGTWIKGKATIVVKMKDGSYFGTLMYENVGELDTWYFKCTGGQYPELEEIGGGEKLILLPSGELSVPSRAPGNYTRN